MLFACQTLQKLRSPAEKPREAQPPVAAKEGKPGKAALPAGVPLKPVTQALKPHIFDCIENTSAPTTMRFPYAKFNYFQHDGTMNFQIAEEGGWPFIVGFNKIEKLASGGDIFVALRGEASGWHKSVATEAVLSLTEKTEGNALIFVDEYTYAQPVKPKAKKKDKDMVAICHRSYHKDGYIGTEIPGFQRGGATRLLRRVLPAPASVVFVSYSNATTPRSEFVPRELRPGYKPDYKNYRDAAKFLTEYILETRFVDSVYENIRGFIDIEGNFEFTKQFWDLLAFIKLEIEPRPDKFFYSAARIEKFDAYPGQIVMINALGLKGVEGSDGVIRFTNKRGNVIIDIVTNPYQPNYWNVGKDVRTATKMEPYKGKDMMRTRLTHFNIPAWAIPRVLETTPFLRRRPQPVQSLQ